MAALWTDSFIFLAAENNSRRYIEYQLERLKMPDTPTIANGIGQQIDGDGGWIDGNG